VPLSTGAKKTEPISAEEVTIPRPAKATQAKRNREIQRQTRNKEKEERRAQRKAEKPNTPRSDDEDPDLAGIVAGPQPPLFEDEKDLA
jgi:hypothetical protein